MMRRSSRLNDSCARLDVKTGVGEYNARTSTTTIILNNVMIGDNFKTATIPSDFILNGGGAFTSYLHGSTNPWNQERTFIGTISGNNHMGYVFDTINPFTGGLVLDGTGILTVTSGFVGTEIDLELLSGRSEVVFGWYGEAGQTYGLEMTENFVTGIWHTVTNGSGADEIISLTGEMDKTNAFDRVYLSE